MNITTVVRIEENAIAVMSGATPQRVEEAWREALDIFETGEVEGGTPESEDLIMALAGFSTNPNTPESVIEDFWRNDDLRLLVDGVWREFCEELMELPETPDSIREEIKERYL